jgi:hypothetical protein
LVAGRLFAASAEDTGSGPTIAKAGGVLVASTIAAILYSLVLPTPLRRGAIVAVIELLLAMLIASLLSGVVLIVMAGIQLKSRPKPPSIPTTSAARGSVA